MLNRSLKTCHLLIEFEFSTTGKIGSVWFRDWSSTLLGESVSGVVVLHPRSVRCDHATGNRVSIIIVTITSLTLNLKKTYNKIAQFENETYSKIALKCYVWSKFILIFDRVGIFPMTISYHTFRMHILNHAFLTLRFTSLNPVKTARKT